MVNIIFPTRSVEAVGFDDFTAANGTSPDRRVNSAYINTRYRTVWETHAVEATGFWFIQSNRLYCTTSGTLVMVSEPRLRNVYVSMDINFVTIPTTTRNIGLVIRDANSSVEHGHFDIRYVGPQSTNTTHSQVRVNYVNGNFVRTTYEAVDVTLPTVGSTFKLSALVRDSHIDAFWNDEKVISSVFMNNNASGMVGVSSSTMTSTTGFHIDNFYCERL